MGSPKLFQIGEMARLFHLSVSSIRHYEQLGLLKPEYTDPETGYRYYTPRQFEVQYHPLSARAGHATAGDC